MSSVLAVNAGKVVPFAPNGAASAFVKSAQTRVAVTAGGFAGDEHADAVKHGGPDKAVHQYPFEHYAAWRAAGVDPERLAAFGSFGENITSAGMTEAAVCIGDVYAVGSGGVVLAVTQTRQPCWKIGARFGKPELSAEVQKTGRTGWHYRVVHDGTLAPGDEFTLLERPLPAWTLARLIETLYVRTLDRDALTELAAMEPLARKLRDLAQRRLDRAEVEPWVARLTNAP